MISRIVLGKGICDPKDLNSIREPLETHHIFTTRGESLETHHNYYYTRGESLETHHNFTAQTRWNRIRRPKRSALIGIERYFGFRKIVCHTNVHFLICYTLNIMWFL